MEIIIFDTYCRIECLESNFVTSNDDPVAFPHSNVTDHRDLGSWQTRYGDQKASNAIKLEALYLFFLLFSAPVALFAIWRGGNFLTVIPHESYRVFTTYAFSWVTGTLGGTLYSIKWLYHVVGRGWWNEDRRLWRLFTPLLSGGLSFAVITLITSGLIHVFDAHEIKASSATVIGIAFLTGYFSDSAIAKLSELADTIFGVVKPSIKPKLPDESKPQRREG